jgi:hypothetical protein
MSYKYGSSLVPGAYHYGGGGLGVLGSAVPSSGDNGAGYLYNDLSLPADAGKEVRGLIETFPVGLATFDVFEDSSFTASGPDGVYTFTYRLYVDGVDSGTAIGTITIGSVGGGTLTGAVALDDLVGSGSLVSAPSVLSGGVTLGNLVAAGQMSGQPFTLSFNPRFYRRIRQRRFSTRLDRKDPAERVTVTWDFSYEAFGGLTIVGTPVVAIALKRGTIDPEMAAMLFTTPVVTGTLVMVGVQDGLHRNDYALRCEADLSDGQHLVQTYVLPVRTAL